MNTEELELSLRDEFENYLKNALAEMKQEVSAFQEKIETELDEQKTRLQEKIEDEVNERKANFAQTFQSFSEKFETDQDLEDSFTESITEHLKLARDEGARITATAIAEAEKLQEETAPAASASADFSEIRDAINEISSKDSQSEILKSLVDHAAQYTPRGAFFIVKNEHLVGWRVFGREEHKNPQAVREVFFPVSADTALSESVKSLETVESSYGSYEDDSIYLNQLDFEQPEKMYAIPLVARGRGVAVLYADAGTNGDIVNAEVLETLVRVAGLTVEVLASSKPAKRQTEQENYYETEERPETEDVQEFEEQAADVDETESQESYSFSDTSGETQELTEEYSPPVIEEDSFSYQEEFQAEPIEDEPESEFEKTEEDEVSSAGFEFKPVEETSENEYESFQEVSEEQSQTSYGDFSWSQSSETDEESEDFSSDETEPNVDYAPYESVIEEDSISSAEEFRSEPDQSFKAEAPVQFDDSSQVEESQFEFQQGESGGYDFETSSDIQTDDYSIIEENPAEETISSFDTGYQETTTDTEDEAEQDNSQAPVETESVSTASVRPRFGDRNVDLPIEVTEDERRLHNDARRFARLLVSEIKLYNEQKVKEGRDSSDLYERLREAIDRSREMYDKRVQPPVAAKFDYFHYELVNTLAEGEEPKLGGSYPGATI